MYKNTIKNKLINKTNKSIKRITELIKNGRGLIEYSEKISDVSPGHVSSEYFFGWKSEVEAFLSELENDNFYNNFKKYCDNDSEQAINIGISILSKCRDYLRSSFKNGNYWNYINPFWIFWQLLRFLWRYKIYSIITTVLTGLLVVYLTNLLGWNK